MLVTYFYHKTTRVPGAGLTATVTLVNANNDTRVLDNAPLTELTSLEGAYVHPYKIDRDIDYIAYFSCTDTNYLPSIDKLYIPASGFGMSSGNRGNQYEFNAQDRKNIQDLLEMKKDLEKYFNDTYSHIDVAKSDVINTIEAIEIPETDFSNISEGIGTLKQRFTKLDNWIKKKDEKEKSDELVEKEGEYSSMLSDIEKEYKTILSSKESEIEALKTQLEESKKKEDGYEAMVDVLEEEIQETKDKVEKETKENLIKTISTL